MLCDLLTYSFRAQKLNFKSTGCKMNEGPPLSEFTLQAKARAAAIKNKCATECVSFIDKTITMLKDTRTNFKDCTAAFQQYDDCFENCSKKMQKLHRIEHLSTRVAS